MSTPTGEEREAAKLAPTDKPRGRIPSDTFANRLVLARKLAGLTIRDAAKAAGLNYGSWSNWENGMRPADILDVTERISDALDIDREWLLFGGALEGPRGRPVRPATKRPGTDTLHYPSAPVRPSSTRPTAGRPKTRTDRRAPNVGRPVIIDRPEGAIRSRLANVA
jgi:transcriptional regulator with XRE-family HTH domain